MLKWCAIRKGKSEVILADAQCKKDQIQGHSYQALDFSFRKEADIVAISSFPQQKIEQASLGTSRQISYLNIPYFISEIPAIEYENRQYRAWIRNIKTALQEINDNGWKNSIKSILKELNIKNDHLIKEYERTAKEIQSLEELLEKIQEDNVEMVSIIDSYQSEVSKESIKKSFFSSLTEAYTRRISKESGYDSQGSISSTETVVLEESDSVFVQAHVQMKELEKKNKIYKEWINSLNRKLDYNYDFKLIKLSNLKTFEDLKSPSFKKIELKQKNRENEKIIQSLEVQIIKNLEINATYQDLLSEEARFHRSKDAYLDKLNELEERLNNEQKELEDLGCYSEKVGQLHKNMETFTECLTQTKKLISLLKI
ncbi:hypothetical protein [Candidatus Rhabdochlamydia porcellionis]|jgi:hypothetical protein|uniref:Uncharacterized protein n=1 Tax=Candidatus Rhabdochlamydia porcellionis TaxID=225148 RepID=A0ABX8YZ07_9BACT|nr:hypothetical protein [Candidatus Rhabdochlamydia porcellionis]QZA58534.1 hypothetical protein RHAB15C_0000410 [Candidatus Rhabdochlamydia porcellionis]